MSWKIGLGAAAAAAALSATSIAAQPQRRAEAFEALIACRAIADEAARFACLDRTSAVLEEAAKKGDIVVVDRQQIRETRKTLFGLDLPSFKLFDDDKTEEVKEVDGIVESAFTDQDGRWVVRLADGALWRQIDSNPLALSPKKGMKVEIKRASMGSYMMRVAGQPGLRVRRTN